MTTKIRLLHDTITIPTGAVAVTQSASDNTTKVATTAYVTTAIANLADSAPSTLNTLNELAAALGDDANFSTTVTNSIAAKLPLAGGAMTGDLTVVDSGGLGIQTSGYSLLSAANNARPASGSIRLGNGTGSTGLVIDYTDQGQTVATIKNVYNQSTDSELTIQSPHITFDTGTSYTEAMRIDSSGNVGVGTITPTQWASYTDSGATVFQIKDTSERARIVINGGNGAHLDLVDYAGGTNDKHMNMAVDGGILKFGSLNDAGNAFVQNNIMVMDLGTGNVGINNTSPSHKLDVTGTIRAYASGSGNAWLYAQNDNKIYLTGIRGTSPGTANAFSIYDLTADKSRFRINSDGGIAIGEDNAGYSGQILSIKAGAGDNVLYGESTDTKCIVSLRDNSSTANIGYGALANAHAFFQDGTEVARISTGSADKYPTSGNGGIGGAGTNLHLHGDDSEIRMANQIIHSDNSGLTKFTIRNAYGYHSTGAELSLDSGYISFNTGSSYTEKMRIDAAGLVSINPINNSYNFKVFATDTDSFFGVREDANNSVLVQIDRSDGYTGFLYNGHTMALSIGGALSKASGSFKIDHPLESKKDTHHLVHSFVEAPQADNIYRGVVVLENGTATINLDTVSGMSEGTYVLLNTNTSCFTSNETDWDAVKGSVSGNILTISCQNHQSTATVSWLVIGERHDQHMKDTDWTDENGKVIVEPTK